MPRGDRVVTIQHVIRAAHLPVARQGTGLDRRDLFESRHCLLNVYSSGTIYGAEPEMVANKRRLSRWPDICCLLRSEASSERRLELIAHCNRQV